MESEYIIVYIYEFLKTRLEFCENSYQIAKGKTP